MLKRIMVALAGLFLMLGLAALPATGAQSTLDMYPDFEWEGVPEQVLTVPANCTATPIEVRSARNFTATPAEFYANSTCSGQPLATIAANNGEVDVIFDEVQEIGATHFKAG